MNIKEIEVFDLYEDGTLVIKTNMEEKNEKLKYAWYIRKDEETIFKSKYQNQEFMAFNIDKSGLYAVKAFVIDDKLNKISKETKILIDYSTSPKLIEKELSKINVNVNVNIQFLNKLSWKINIYGQFPKSSKFAWYIYKRGKSEPIYKQMYSDKLEYIYEFAEKGQYKLKLFIISNGNKYSNNTQWFDVKSNEEKNKNVFYDFSIFGNYPTKPHIEQKVKLEEKIKMSLENENWLNKYTEILNKIPDSNGSRYYQKLKCRIGIICDEFFYDSIKDAADFIYVTPDNWKSVIDNGIDIFMFVSAWRGLEEQWRGLANVNSMFPPFINDKRKTAFEILEYCKDKSIPTVFYSKEDPPDYEIFLDYAKKCDYIFTSAKECVSYYKSDCKNENVKAVTFGINPQLHNPIGSYNINKEKTILFSGSWMKKFPVRCKDLSMIFDGIISSSYDLHIIDRNYPMHKGYEFPNKYFKYTSPAIEHHLLQKVHKLFNWAVNINSVKSSETMFANRAFELLANGVLLLSNFSVGINSILPNIMIVNDSSEVLEIVNNMTDEQIYERQIAGIRLVMSKHTCYDRISEFLSFCDIDANQPIRKIVVIADEITASVKENFDRQAYQYKLLVSKEKFTEQLFKEYDMITWFDKNAYYGQFYLEDLANGFKYTNCDYITKDAWYNGKKLKTGVEHNYVKEMKSKYRTLFWRDSYTYEFIINLNGRKKLKNGYSIDRFSYNSIISKQEEQKENYLLSVIVPIFNNGEHLYGKCFNSLTRSSMFNNMEIIFVDDGSTDDRTLKIEDYIKSQYSNVSIYRFNDGGSGSASRPRNKGVEIASSEYVTFLDPDNEAVCNGYARLYDIAVKEDFDLVFGSMYKCDNNVKCFNYYNIVKRKTDKDCFYDGLNIKEIDFLTASIQAMVIRKEIIIKNNIEEVVGAIGEDTLFSWQLLSLSKRIKVCEFPVHIYYAQTSDSVTNLVNINFFNKTLKVQIPKLEWLKKFNLIENFMESKYNYYTTNWILYKFSVSENSEECAKVVEKILDIYSDYYNGEDDIINNFMLQCKNKNYNMALDVVRKAFPNNYTRPMPTLKEILSSIKTTSLFDIKFKRNGSVFTFYNNSGNKGTDKYAWVILLAISSYSKVYSTSYKNNSEFSFDFKKLEPKLYKIRSFVLKPDNTKSSEDIAYIQVNEDKSIDYIYYKSKAIELEKEREYNGN